MLILARMASARSPLPITTSTPVSRSVATARNGIGSSSKSSTKAALRVSSFRIKPRFWPVTRPPPSRIPSMLTPRPGASGKRQSSCLRRTGLKARPGSSRKLASQSSSINRCSISSTGIPVAYKAATADPALVPTTRSTGTFISSSTRNTPTWAMPLAPPPLSTSPTVGRLSCGGWAQATGAHSTASNARVIASRFTGGRYRGSAVLFVIVSKGKVGYIRYHRFRHYAVNTEVCTRGGQAPVIQVLKHWGLDFLMFHQGDPGWVQSETRTRQNIVNLLAGNRQSVTGFRLRGFTAAGRSFRCSGSGLRGRPGAGRLRWRRGRRRRPGHWLHIGDHAVLAQDRQILFCLCLLQLVADHHRLATEHTVELLDTGLEQAFCTVANCCGVQARHALSLEHKLEHSNSSFIFANHGSMIAEIRPRHRPGKPPGVPAQVVQTVQIANN